MAIGDHSSVRKMINGDWSIPYSCGFNILKVHNFNASEIHCVVDYEMVIIIKFTNCPDQEDVMAWCVDNLRCRVNEEEVQVLDMNPFASRRQGSWKPTKSRDFHTCDNCFDGGDCLQGIVRTSEKFFCRFEDYASFPFDSPTFHFRFELSQF